MMILRTDEGCLICSWDRSTLMDAYWSESTAK
jgi:hypothetical protein